MKTAVFLDTSYVLAYLFEDDIHHATAIKLEQDIRRRNVCITTTHAVVFEILNALSKPRYRATGLQFVSLLQSNPATELVEVSTELLRKGTSLYRQRPDKAGV